jgi:hypothetical protein
LSKNKVSEVDMMKLPAHNMYMRAKQFVDEEKKYYERDNKIIEAFLSVRCPLASTKGGRRPRKK